MFSSTENSEDEETRLKTCRYRRRLQIMMRALYIICGTSMQKTFMKQQTLMKHLNDAAMEVKTSKESTRKTVLESFMEKINLHLREMATPLPLNLGMISHKKSLITIFGHKHEIKNFIKILENQNYIKNDN